MAFEAFEKTPEVAPLLVRLYDTHNLYALAKDKESDGACSELTTIMTDLLSIKLSEKESELITDVLLALMKQAQKDLKKALSERLASMDTVPLRMILSIANDEIDVAEAVLRDSPVLQDLDLCYIIQGKGVEHARPIAERSGLSASVINMLADTKDFQVAVNLAENDGVQLTQHAYRIFGDMAKYSETLARPLLNREDLPQDIAGRLYQFVSDELKQNLSERFGIGSAPALAALDDITIEMTTPAHKASDDDQRIAYAHNQQRRGELKFPTMLATLRRGQYSTFMAQFSVYTGLPSNTVKAMVRQDNGKALATACRALDVSKSDFVSLYLLTDRFRAAHKRVVNHKELTRIMTMFDEISPEEARQILKNSRN